MSGSAAARGVPRPSASGRAGMTLIEASAGTGKTRELTGIVARLVVQERRRLDEVLVVTFTRAATAELRERIRETLRSARRGFATGRADEGSQAAELLAAWREDAGIDPEVAARRLDAALQDIDRANVLTIHGFCQRVLADLAFDGGFPFEFEVSGDQGDLVAEAARDFWRRRMYTASRTLAAYAAENGFRPDDLAAWVRQWRAKPDLRIDGGNRSTIPSRRRRRRGEASCRKFEPNGASTGRRFSTRCGTEAGSIAGCTALRAPLPISMRSRRGSPTPIHSCRRPGCSGATERRRSPRGLQEGRGASRQPAVPRLRSARRGGRGAALGL